MLLHFRDPAKLRTKTVGYLFVVFFLFFLSSRHVLNEVIFCCTFSCMSVDRLALCVANQWIGKWARFCMRKASMHEIQVL